MKRLLPVLIGFALLLLSSTEGWSLPPCPGSPASSWSTAWSWTNCFGTNTWGSGDKYVGEWKDGKRNGQGTYTSADGYKYVGEWKDNAFKGQGTFTNPNGDKYVGEFKDGVWHGQGTYTYGNGNKYVGEYNDGSRHGQGTFTYADGRKYVGEFNGLEHGQGTMTHANGDTYIGEWKYGLNNGQGTMTHANGDTYIGEWKYGLNHGQGTKTYADGRVEEGIWEYGALISAKKLSPTVTAKKSTPKVDQQKRLELARRTQEALQVLGLYSGKLDGIIGVITKSAIQRWQKRNGYSGTGEVTELQLTKLEQEAITHLAKKKSKPTVTAKKTPIKGSRLPPCPESGVWNNCFGTVTGASGKKYVGEYKDDMPHGQGTFTFADGEKYVGEWKGGKEHGQGTYTFGPKSKSAGDKYVGEVRDGKRNGQGTYTSANGDTYVGEYRDGKRHGQGTLIFAKSGNKYVGEWKGGDWHGQGTFTFADGENYVGEWKDGKSHGQGTYTYDNGDKFVGEFKDGKKHGQGTFTFAKSGNKYVGEFKDDNRHGQGTFTFANGRVKEGIFENGKFLYAKKTSPTVTAKKPKSSPKSATSGSGFFISKLGHVITNQHVVSDCRKVTIGDNSKKQVTANVMETDTRNDLALLKISSMQMASAETKSLVAKLGITVTPLASQGLLRSNSVELGEDVVVAGFPFGDIFSNTIKITKGVVSAKRGMSNDSGQFQIDAAVQHGSSGGPIYDENGNIIGVVVSQLNKLKVAKAIGSLPELVNFGIKASTVKQFLNSSGLPSSWSRRSKRMSTKEIAKIAENQTVMVVCHR